MPLYRASLQTLGAIVLLALALACHGKGGSGNGTTAIISGTVTYQRVPLVKDAQGKPTGLADATVPANLLTLPAQGVYIRIFQQIAQTDPNGTISNAWILAQTTPTSTTGTYSVTVTSGRPTMVEVSSTFYGGVNQVIQLIAEPQGINSPKPVSDRLQYALRKAADGTSPVGNNAPATVLAANSIVNFTVGLTDEWWVYNPSISSSTGAASFVDQARLETDPALGTGRTPGLGTGSRVLGIGDTIASFVTAYGAAAPSTNLALHYWPGVSDPGGSYVVYDRSLIPSSLASGTYFGTLRGGSANDDAWDEGVILPLLARNVLYASNLSRTFSVPRNPLFPPSALLTDLSADVARIEGLAQAMAANVLKSPYLADTQGTGQVSSVLDVRDISSLSAAQLGPYSAPAVRAFAWELILKANSLPSPGVATDWVNINALSSARFFLAPSGLTNGATDSTAHDIEPLNIFSQITRLKEVKATTEPVDLAAVFTDAVLTNLGSPFGITWPRPTTGAYTSFVRDWGTDPTGTLPPVVLSMAKATQVNLLYPSVTLAYPDVSAGEVFYAAFSLSADKRCTLTATISPALGAAAYLDVDLPFMPRTFTFSGAGGTTEALVIPVNSPAPFYHPVRLHMLSPSVLQPDVTVTLTLTPAN
jgi:hypothetical protein